MISKLKDLGYITQESFDGRKRTLKSNIEITILKTRVKENFKAGLKKTTVPIKENFKADIISNNTTNNTRNIPQVFPIQIPMDWPVNEFIALWDSFMELRTKKKKPVTGAARKLIIDELLVLSNHKWEIAKQIIHYSIKGGYPKFYPLKEEEHEITKDPNRYGPDKY
jgi:hypothetical protein